MKPALNLKVLHLAILLICFPGCLKSNSSNQGGTSAGNPEASIELLSATVNGTSLILSFNQTLDISSVPAPSDFTLEGDLSGDSVTEVGISDKDLNLTLGMGAKAGDGISISYTKGTSPIQDALGSEGSSFTSLELTNNSPDVSGCTGTKMCGGTADKCYDDSAAISDGYAFTPSGKCLKYIDADGAGSGNFSIWIEEVSSGDAKVLKSTGVDSWQEKLKANGRTHQSGSYFSVDTDNNNEISGSADASLASARLSTYLNGRTCPTNVFYDADESGAGATDTPSDFTNSNMCLYYSHIRTNTSSMDQDVSSVGTTGVSAPSNANSGGGVEASWYESNHVQCGGGTTPLGMRLITLFETDVNTCIAPGTFPQCSDFTDNVSSGGSANAGSPAFAAETGQGVPLHPGSLVWTASSYPDPSSNYILVSYGSSNGSDYYSTDSALYLTCVLP